MSVPKQINDGNWSLLTPMSTEVSFPFSDKGDNDTFVAKVKYRQDKASYRPRATMTKLRFDLGHGYLTKLGDLRDINCGLYEFDDEFASLPNTRREYGSFCYTIQWWRGITEVDVDPSKYFYNVNFDVEEQTFTVAAEVEYEYFLNTPPKPLIKPRVFLLFGLLQSIGGAPIIGNRLIAEDSQVTIWKAKIYQRRTVYVTVQAVQAIT